MRIPYGLNYREGIERPPILLVHSFTEGGVAFALHGETESPAFYLSEAGYDIWILNTRGTSQSLGHENLDWRFDREYWQTSWLDFSNDYTDTIQHIVDYTIFDNVAVAVCNMYNSQFFAGISHRPDFYHERVSIVFSLGPILQYQYSNLPNVKFFCKYPEGIALSSSIGFPYISPPRNTLFGSITAFFQEELAGLFPLLTEFSASLILFENTNIYDPQALINTFSHQELSIAVTFLEQIFQN